LEVGVAWEDPRVSGKRAVSELSLSTKVSTWMESLGTLLDKSLFLGVNVDLLGSEEYQGLCLTRIDARHGTPRLHYLSSGIGLTFKF
jgi:hypothetical protein